MYVPPHFAQTDAATLHAFIERYSFGLLVSDAGGEPFATHLPFLLDRTAGPHGALVGHLARANPHWQTLEGRTALAVFSGAELNAALRRWQREEDLAGKQYQALLLLAGKSETAERYAPVVVDTALACVMRTLITAQNRRAALAEAGQAVSRHLLVREAATLAGIVAPRHALPALARLAGRHWVTLVGSKQTPSAERRLAVTRVGREAVAESGGLDDGQQDARAGRHR
jgi:hypothetical protein